MKCWNGSLLCKWDEEEEEDEDDDDDDDDDGGGERPKAKGIRGERTEEGIKKRVMRLVKALKSCRCRRRRDLNLDIYRSCVDRVFLPRLQAS